ARWMSTGSPSPIRVPITPSMSRCSSTVRCSDPREALEGSEQRTVDEQRLMLGVIGTRIGECEALGHGIVELYRPELPRAPDRVGHVQVDLRPIEGAVAGVQLIRKSLRVERFGERGLGAVPHLVRADALLGPGGELQPRLDLEAP